MVAAFWEKSSSYVSYVWIRAFNNAQVRETSGKNTHDQQCVRTWLGTKLITDLSAQNLATFRNLRDNPAFEEQRNPPTWFDANSGKHTSVGVSMFFHGDLSTEYPQGCHSSLTVNWLIGIWDGWKATRRNRSGGGISPWETGSVSFLGESLESSLQKPLQPLPDADRGVFLCSSSLKV